MTTARLEVCELCLLSSRNLLCRRRSQMRYIACWAAFAREDDVRQAETRERSLIAADPPFAL